MSKFESLKAILLGLNQKIRNVKQSFHVIHENKLNGIGGIKIESNDGNNRFFSVKEFLGTNKGIGLISFLLILSLLLIHFVRHKHSDAPDENVSGWNTPIVSTTPSTQIQQTPLIERQNLQNQINLIKQDISSIQADLKQITLNNARQPYQLLGVRFDDETNQWVADVKLENSIQSFKAGENFSGWKVISVDSEGALIQ